MRRTTLLIAAILIALIIGLAAIGCGDDDDDGADAGGTTTEATTAADTTTAPAPTTPTETTGGDVEGDAQAGLVVFEESGCGSCHTLAAAGSEGAIGPDLDETLEGQDAAYIRAAIVDPNAVVAEGYSANIMPQQYGDQLSDQQINDLVALLQQ